MAYKQPDPSEAGGRVPNPKSYRLQSVALSEFILRSRGQALAEELRKKVMPWRKSRRK